MNTTPVSMRAQRAGRSVVRRALVLLVIAIGLQDKASLAETVAPAFAAGEADYQAGRFEAAAALFARLPPNDARSHYNRGNALARAGRLQAALDAYDESLRLRPGDPDTLHNRELVARLLQSPENKPPPPSSAPPPPNAPPPPANQRAEAERAAAQWLRRPQSDADGLLKRKLALEEARRREGRAP